MFDFKIRPDLTVNNKEVISLIKMLYCPQCGEIKTFETFLDSVFSQRKSTNNFLKLIYQSSVMKPTRVTGKTITTIDNILTNSFTDKSKHQFLKLLA